MLKFCLTLVVAFFGFLATTQAEDMPLCSDLVESACQNKTTKLSNNYIANHGQNSYQTLDGSERVTGIPYASYFFLEAALKAKEKLPKDFLEQERTDEFFHSAFSWLHSHGHRFDRNRLIGLWRSGFDKTLSTRLKQAKLRKDKDLHAVVIKFWTEVYGPIWSLNAKWLAVEKMFLNVQKTYILFLNQQTTLPPPLREKLLTRIRTAKLLPPYLAFQTHDCSIDTKNAFYIKEAHAVTVCAGDFTARQTAATLAHELGHAMGPLRAAYELIQNSPILSDLASLREEICEVEAPLTCSQKWSRLQNGFDHQLNYYKKRKVELPKLLACLQDRKVRPMPKQLDVHELIIQRTKTLAQFQTFTKIAAILDSGKASERKKLYICQPNHLLTPADEDLMILAFISEYQCRLDSDNASRLEDAIRVSRELEYKYLAETIRVNAEFSSNPWMLIHGYSQSVEERFADYFGARVFGRLLSEIPDLEERRDWFLASTLNMCTKKGDSAHSEEDDVERAYSLEPHSINFFRRQENLVSEIRAAIRCSKNTAKEDCSW